MEAERKLFERKITAKKRKLALLFKDPAVASWRRLIAAYQVNFAIFEEAINAGGMSYARFQILYMLYFEGPTSASCLAQYLFVSRANMSTFCKRLEQDKLIKRLPIKPGSKRTHFWLTQKGEVLFEELFPAHIARVKKIIVPFSKKTMEELLTIANGHECE